MEEKEFKFEDSDNSSDERPIPTKKEISKEFNFQTDESEVQKYCTYVLPYMDFYIL